MVKSSDHPSVPDSITSHVPETDDIVRQVDTTHHRVPNFTTFLNETSPNDSPERPRLPVRALLNSLPVIEPDSFLYATIGDSASNARPMVARPVPAPQMHIIQTDKTRSLVRALRLMAQNAGTTNGVASRDSSTASKSAPPSEEGTPHRPRKVARRESSWRGMGQEQRISCLKIALTAALAHEASSRVVAMDDALRNNNLLEVLTDPVHEVALHEVAVSTFSWTFAELKAYLRTADMSVTGLRIELARRVHAHLRPPSN